jgi:MFS transporter, ACS family, hexuronate transporter
LQTIPHKPSPLAETARPYTGNVRWWICFLLFLGTTINYMDRQLLGVLKPNLKTELGWTDVDYGHIVMWFQAAYAAGYLLAGRLMDRIGVRLGYALAAVLWSLAAMGHSAARTILEFKIARGALGLAEGGNFPAAIRTVSDWFPKKERALATGLFNGGSNIGPIITPVIVPWIMLYWGWRGSFVIIGAFGFVWVALWLATYRAPEKTRRLSPAELAFIRSDGPDPTSKVSWISLLTYRPTWAYTVAMILTSPIWWFYLFWVPDFLDRRFNLGLSQRAGPLAVVYLMAFVGSITGGWLSSTLIHVGWTINTARKTALLICALCVVPVFLAPIATNAWFAVLLIGLAAAAHQGWSANLYTIVPDTMPRATVSSVVGIGGMGGAIVAMFFANLIGHVLQATHGNYLIPFIIASAAYPIALLVIQILLPRLEPQKMRIPEYPRFEVMPTKSPMR